MRYFLVTTNCQNDADVALRPFKFHYVLTDEQDKYPSFATSHTEQVLSSNSAVFVFILTGQKLKNDRSLTSCFVPAEFLLTHNTSVDPAALRRIIRSLRLYSERQLNVFL